jgi:hypothetical protein
MNRSRYCTLLTSFLMPIALRRDTLVLSGYNTRIGASSDESSFSPSLAIRSTPLF